MRILGSVIIFAAVTVLMKYLVSSSSSQVREKYDGALVFKMNSAYGLFGILSVIITGIIGIIASYKTVKTFEDFIFLSLIIIFILCLCLPFILMARNLKVIASDKKILYYSMTGKKKEILWADINDVKFNNVSLELKLLTDSTSIKLHKHLVGFNKLIELIEKNLNMEIYGEAIASIRSVQKTL